MILLNEKAAEAAAQRAADHSVAAASGRSRFRPGAIAGRTLEPVYAKLAAFRDELSGLEISQLDEYIGIPEVILRPAFADIPPLLWWPTAQRRAHLMLHG